VVGEDLEEAARDGDGLLLGHLGFDPPHVHRPLPGEVPPEHLPRRPSEPTAATPEELHPAAASVAARSLAGVEFQLKPNPPTRGSGGPSWARHFSPTSTTSGSSTSPLHHFSCSLRVVGYYAYCVGDSIIFLSIGILRSASFFYCDKS
jgi:hypothetical protein